MYVWWGGSRRGRRGGLSGGGPSALSENMPHALVELGGLRRLLSRLQENACVERSMQQKPPRATGLPLHSRPLQFSIRSEATIKRTHGEMAYVRSIESCQRTSVRHSDNRSCQRSPLTLGFLPSLEAAWATYPLPQAPTRPHPFDHTKVGSGRMKIVSVRRGH